MKSVVVHGYLTKRKVNSSAFVMWQALAQPYLEHARRRVPRPFNVPLNASFKFYFKNRASEADLSALYEGIQDELQTFGIITNDRLIHAHNGSEKIFDPREPERLEVELTPLHEWKSKNQPNIKRTPSNEDLSPVRQRKADCCLESDL
ncbi:hypothetical protein EP01_06870 [Bdellovibrio bacteriovorus]|uniref:hypothetical protein n=1 Tax=Bdellovibrio bacteriovorus TaxID=959 RepID=UPI00045BFADD|nr:hypothetical protein [Bdellovibrio bacteriovorus]AHZ84658.1 hypothetical protein EP01_06870 [Bdellovibrio bacteriovorus]